MSQDKDNFLGLRCSQDLRDRISAYAEEHSLSNSEAVRNVLDAFLPNEDSVDAGDEDGS